MGLSVHGSLFSEGGRRLLEDFGIKLRAGSIEEEISTSVDKVYHLLRDTLDLDAIEQIYMDSMVKHA